MVQTLLSNEVVAEKVGDRIFPLVVPQGVERFPFVVYDMQGGSGTTTKDGSVDDAVTVQVNVVAKTHTEALTIGNAVRYVLDGYCPRYKEFEIRKTGNIVYNDEYVEALDAYSVNISIDFRTVDF